MSFHNALPHQAVSRPSPVQNGLKRQEMPSRASAAHSPFRGRTSWTANPGCKILDIFEGTQQIQQLIVARRILGKTSAELK
ncbi:hypothetical protein [Nocardia beijingensis]